MTQEEYANLVRQAKQWHGKDDPSWSWPRTTALHNTPAQIANWRGWMEWTLGELAKKPAKARKG